MNLKRLSAMLFALPMTLVAPSTASAVDFWKTIGLCSAGFQAESLEVNFQEFGWQAQKPDEERALQHSAMFNLQYSLAWGKNSDYDIVRELSSRKFLAKPAAPYDWDFYFSDPKGDAVLTVRLLDTEQLCFLKSSRPPLNVVKARQAKKVRDFQIGRFRKDDTQITLYNARAIANMAYERFEKATVDLRYVFVASVSNSGNAQQ
ncbi:hypothetical protein [Ruegeria atlantica]|uniref:Uncharacterized protein n=1 Tax=Ruegeria atlantica TaxID=81569 RepID=A0A0P1E4Q1_9RHOB|nr:hypothetical protein [Ruegeria atlantica]CUH43531.1 hypothetical protein RUM4293_02426 [Ruegeria atlantica]